MLIKEAVKKFMAESAMRGLSKTTIDNLEGTLTALQEHCKLNKIKQTEELSKMDMGKFLMIYNGVKKSSLAAYQTRVKAFLVYLQQEDLLIKLPRLIDIVTDSTIPHFFAIQTLSKIENKIETIEEEMIFKVLLETGLRTTELAELKKDDVNWNTGSIIVRNTKGNADGTVFVSEETAKKLWEYSQKTSLPEIFHYKGKKLDRWKIYYLMNILGKRAGVRINPHAFRHTFGTLMLQSTNNLRQVQVAMRHKSIGSTEKYTHITDKEMVEGHKKYLETLKTGKSEEKPDVIQTK